MLSVSDRDLLRLRASVDQLGDLNEIAVAISPIMSVRDILSLLATEEHEYGF